MAEVDRLLVRIEAETAQLRRELDRAAKTTEAMQRRVEGSSNRAQRAFDRLNRSDLGGINRSMNRLQATASGLQNVLGALGLAFSAREFIQAIDTYNNMQAQLRLVVGEGRALIGVQNDLYALSQRTATDLEANVNLYARISRATQTLNMDYRDQLRMVEAIAQAARISGASQQEASAAVLQFSQGLAAGALRGEELNSILEQMPRLAQALADGLGVPIGALRELGSEGELTAERIAEALLSQADTLETEFGRIERTVGNAWTQLENAVLRAIGVMDDGTAATNDLTDAIDELRRLVEDPAFSEGLNAIGNAIGFIAARAANTIREIGNLVGALKALGSGDYEEAFSRIQAMVAGGPLASAIRERNIGAAMSGAFDDEYAPEDGGPLRIDVPVPYDLGTGGPPPPAPRPNPPPGGRGGSPEIIDLRPRWDTKKPPIPLPKGMTEAQVESEERIFEAARRALSEYDEQLRRTGETIRREMMTPTEELDARLAELNTLFNAGAIDAQTFGRATSAAWEDFGDASKSAIEQTERASDVVRDLGFTFESAFENAVVNGAKLSDVLKGIEQDLIRLAARKLVTEPLAGALDGAFGGGQKGAAPDSFLSPVSGFFASLFHSGGVVGGPAASRLVSSALFEGAQRLHSGGVAGLRGGEVPAILQRGEVVLPRGGAMMMPNIVINNNAPAATVDVQPTNGGRSLEIVIDEVVAGAIKSGGRTQQALRQMGIKPATVAR